MVRGIESIKQGQSIIAKRGADQFIQTTLLPSFEQDPITFALELIKKAYMTKIEYTDYKLSAQYKPNKNNVPVKRFVARMAELSARYAAEGNVYKSELYAPPDAGDKFEYLVVKKKQEYDIRGRMIELKKGDRMEYVRVYLASLDEVNDMAPIDIDTEHYISKPFAGIFARFIAYDQRFQHPSIKAEDDASYKIVDDYSINEASKFLANYIISICGNQRAKDRELGRNHQALYRAVEATFKNNTLAVIKGRGTGHTEFFTKTMESINSISYVSSIGDYLLERFQENKLNILQIYKYYRPGTHFMMLRYGHLDRIKRAAVDIIERVTPILAAVTYRRQAAFEAETAKIRAGGDSVVPVNVIAQVNELNEIEQAAMSDYETAKIMLCTMAACKADISSICDALYKYRAKIATSDKLMMRPALCASQDALRAVGEADQEYHWK